MTISPDTWVGRSHLPSLNSHYHTDTERDESLFAGLHGWGRQTAQHHSAATSHADYSTLHTQGKHLCNQILVLLNTGGGLQITLSGFLSLYNDSLNLTSLLAISLAAPTPHTLPSVLLTCLGAAQGTFFLTPERSFDWPLQNKHTKISCPTRNTPMLQECNFIA